MAISRKIRMRSGTGFQPVAAYIARSKGGVLAAFGVLVILLSACSETAISRGPAGMAPEVVLQASVIVGQTRAQFPQHSGVGIPFQTQTPDKGKMPPPELALVGGGISVTSGLQKEDQKPLTMELYLEKTGYKSGYAKVKVAGGAEEIWPVIAFEQAGRPSRQFAFTYLLVTPQQGLRYLVVIGGPYVVGKEAFFGFEGTLIVPGAGDPRQHLEKWQRAYKIDFGFRYQTPPTYIKLVNQADDHFRGLQSELRKLERMQGELSDSQGLIAAMQRRPADKTTLVQQEQALNAARKKAVALEDALVKQVAATELRFLNYYQAREGIALEYAAFVKTNYYHWRGRSGQQEFYDKWKVVETHHNRIDKLMFQFMNHLKDKTRLSDTRNRVMKTIITQDNWHKNPKNQ